jgi:arylsulfatase A-like enzyme
MSLQEETPRSQGLTKVFGSVLGASTFIFAAALCYSVLDAVFVRLIFLGARFSDYGVLTYFYRSYVLYAVFLAAAAGAAAVLGFWLKRMRPRPWPGFAAVAAGGALCSPVFVLAALANRAAALTVTHPAMIAVDIFIFLGWFILSALLGAKFYNRFGPDSGGRRRVVWAVLGYGGAGLFVGVLWAVFAIPAVTRPAAPERGMNVLLVSIDALRRDHLGCYGYERVKTPELDRFAASAATFEYAYCNSPWTLPSMASMVTGRYPTVCGIDTGHRIRRDLPTLAEILRDNGYRTEAYVTNVFMHPEYGYARGFDVYLMNGGLRRLYPLRGTLLYKWTVAAVRAWRSKFGRNVDDTTFNGEATVAALRRLAAGRRPFFVWCHFMDPHGPYTPPRGYVPDYPGTSAAEAYRLMDELLSRGWGLAEMPMEEKFADEFEMLYDGEIAYVDEHFGKIMGALEEEGVADETVVIVLNDHGEEFFEHGGYEHGHTLYPELIDMALVVRAPGHDLRKAAVSRYVSHVDIAPSVVDALGLATEAVFDGGSFLASPRPNGGAVFAEHVKRGNEKKAVRSGGWLLIRDSVTGVPELYDLTSDRGAQENLAGKDLAQEEILGREVASYVNATEGAAKAMGAPPEMNLPEERKRRLQGLGYVGP